MGREQVILSGARPSELSPGVILAAIDLNGGIPVAVNLTPDKGELRPFKNVGTRTTDYRTEELLKPIMYLGQLRMVAGLFPRSALGATNSSSKKVEIAIGVDWSLAPHDFVETQMLLQLYDTLRDLAPLSSLVSQVPEAIRVLLKGRLGDKLNSARLSRDVQQVTKGLAGLALPNRPTDRQLAGLFDAAVLGLALALLQCTKPQPKRAARVVDAASADLLMEVLAPSGGNAERKRVLGLLEEVASNAADYRAFLKGAQAALRNCP